MLRTRGIHTAVGVAVALALGASALPAQQTNPQSIYWGAGLIDIPVAWVSPISGDFSINYSGKRFQIDPNAPKINYDDQTNSQLAFSLSLFGRLELGWAAYSANPEWGFFGQGLIMNEEDFRPNGGLALLIPSVAIGMRNVGPYEHIDRFGVGYELLPPDNNTPNSRHEPDSLHRAFDTANTFFGVATKTISLNEIRPTWPGVTLSASVGYGNGLFREDGGLGARYSHHNRNGLFYGGKVEFMAGPNLGLTLMAEDNAWDYNVGASLDYRGIRAGLYVTEVGSGDADLNASNPSSFIYNYRKVAFTLGWQSNVFALLRGNFLQNRAAQLERQRQGLLAEIARRQQRIASLELEINRYEAQNLLELEQRRTQAETELRAERDALKRLEERLRRVEQQLPDVPPQSQQPNQPPPAPPAQSQPQSQPQSQQPAEPAQPAPPQE